jgi:hypothetical protein
MQKDQIGVPRFGQGGLRSNPVDPCLLLSGFARRFGFGSIAFPEFVSLKTCLCNEETTIEQLTDGIGKVDVCLALEEVIDAERDRQR